VTLDLDSSDTEVYGRLKEGAAFNHRGQRSYDSQLATWAERRRVLAAELRSGNLTEHPTAVKVLRRALKALPATHGRVRARMDSGFESVATFKELRRQGVGFTCSLHRTPALHRLRLEIASRAWRPALLMPRAEIAEMDTCYRRSYVHTERQDCVMTIRQRSMLMNGPLNSNSSH